ncbi:hypothetical protein JHK87_052073 [Glycine soja]|nr:hypothetical protein JHK87_052073 [Glycine soja]
MSVPLLCLNCKDKHSLCPTNRVAEQIISVVHFFLYFVSLWNCSCHRRASTSAMKTRVSLPDMCTKGEALIDPR